MDKIQYTNIHIRSHDGFALMITLSVLSVIMALTMILLSYFQEVQQEASNTKALIQADLYYADIVTIFKGIKDTKTLFPLLYSGSLPFNTEDNTFSLLLTCKPLSKGININWLGLESTSKNQAQAEVAQEVFDMIAEEYDIEDTSRLLELIYEEIGLTKKETRLHQKKGIISFQQFLDVLSRYQFEVDDSKIGLIPWKKYFNFSIESNKIDGDYSSPELISFLFDIEISTVQEWFSQFDKSSLESFVRENAGDYEARKTLFAGKEILEKVWCSVRYVLDDTYYKFTFEYIDGGAKHFEFYGKQ